MPKSSHHHALWYPLSTPGYAVASELNYKSMWAFNNTIPPWFTKIATLQLIWWEGLKKNHGLQLFTRKRNILSLGYLWNSRIIFFTFPPTILLSNDTFRLKLLYYDSVMETDIDTVCITLLHSYIKYNTFDNWTQTAKVFVRQLGVELKFHLLKTGKDIYGITTTLRTYCLTISVHFLNV
jgi:hypothetical protein